MIISTAESDKEAEQKHLARSDCDAWTAIAMDEKHNDLDDCRPRTSLPLSAEIVVSKTILHLSIKEPFFTQVVHCKKIVEGRLAKQKYLLLKKMDQIVFNNKAVVDVIDIKQYTSFHEMIKAEGIGNVLPGIASIEEGVEVYRTFYTSEEENQFGVVGIKVKFIKIIGEK